MSHSHFQKMILIPEDASSQLVSSMKASVSQQERLDQDMSDILNRTDLSIEQKWKLYQQALHRYLDHTPSPQKPIAIPLFDQEGTSTKSLPLFSLILESMPKTLVRNTSTLLNLLLTSNRISWDQTGAVSIDNNVLPGSNIIDLIHDVIRKRTSQHPVGLDVFKSFLRDINVPNELINFQFGAGAVSSIVPFISQKKKKQRKKYFSKEKK